MIYKVHSRIDLAGKTYVPENALPHGSPINSAADGHLVMVDSSGFVEMDHMAAQPLLKAGALKPLDEEIARLVKVRDEALESAKRAQDELDMRQAKLQHVIDTRKNSGAAGNAATLNGTGRQALTGNQAVRLAPVKGTGFGSQRAGRK